ncbi:unnamed protein product, partial [Ectocarpus sp. 12 AP-2014]
MDRLNEWTERKGRGWEGDVPPVEGLTMREEVDKLLAQLPEEGTIKLAYTAGTLLSAKRSLLVMAPGPVKTINTFEQQRRGSAANKALLLPGSGSDGLYSTGGGVAAEGLEDARPVATEGGRGRCTNNAGGGTGLGDEERRTQATPTTAVKTKTTTTTLCRAADTAFESVIFMLRSLGSPIQMCEMVECLSRRTWLSDDQLYSFLDAFSDEPRMSEPRCRVFLALLPNIRHNTLKALGEHLSQRVKHLQGIPLPDFSAGAPKRVTAGAAARARAAAAARQREGTGGPPLMRWERDAAMARMDEERKEQAEAEEAARRAKILDDGWKGGPFLDGLGNDIVGVLAGCSASTFRRFGLEGCLTPLEEERLGSVIEGSSAYFNPFAPQGHYNLDMTLPSDREVFRALLGLDKVNRAHVGMKGLLDPSQHGNSHHLRNFRLGGGRPVKFGLLSRRRARTKLNKRGAKTTKKKAAKQAKEPAKAKKTTNKAPAGKTEAGNAKPSSRDNKNARGAKGKSPQMEKRLPLESVKLAGTRGGFVKRFPTMPTASRISFDFLHYIRPSPGANSTPKECFDQLVQFLSNWMSCGNANGGNGEDDNDDDEVNDSSAIDVNPSNGGGGGANTNDNGHDDGGAVKRKKGRVIVNFLRNLCHVFYFNCNQVVDLLRVFPREDDEHESRVEKDNEAGTRKEAGSSCREEVFVAVVCRITDESNLDLCLGALTDREVSRCEARLGPVALFMPTQPDGEYKLDLRA